MTIEFHQTGYGKRFFDGQLPALIKSIETLAEEMSHLNQGLAELIGGIIIVDDRLKVFEDRLNEIIQRD